MIEEPPIYGWHPAIQVLKAAILAGEPEIICFGPRGSGKTIAICDMLLHLAHEYPGMTQRWGRIDQVRMQETVIKTFEEEVICCYPNLKPSGMNAEKRNGYGFDNGSSIMIHGLRDVESLKSMRADVWWPNEAGELTESAWEELGGTSRQDRFGKFPFQVKITDVNPLPPAHWTNTRCPPVPDSLYPKVLDDGTRMNEWMSPEKYAQVFAYNTQKIDFTRYKARKILFFHAENPGFWDFQNWCWRKPGLDYVRKQLSRMTGSRRARYLEGRPAAEEDVVFPEFEREIHVIQPFKVPSDWPVWVGYDPGFRHCCAVVFVACAPNGQLFIIDEIHGSRINLDELAPRIRTKAEKYRIVRWLSDPQGSNQGQQATNGLTIRDIMAQRHQLYFDLWKAEKGVKKNAQVESVRLKLTEPLPMRVFGDCLGVIGEFETWKNKLNTKGEMPEGDERYENKNNDAMDSLCGIVAENPTFAQPHARFA